MDSHGRLVPHYGANYRTPWYIKLQNLFGSTAHDPRTAPRRAMAVSKRRRITSSSFRSSYGSSSRFRPAYRRRSSKRMSGRRNKVGRKNVYYPRKAYVGSRRFTASKIARAIETQMFQVVDGTNTRQLTNGLATTTREYCWSPFQSLLQGTGTGQFSGTAIWMKGILVDFFVTGDTTQSYHVQIDCFKDTDDTDFTTPWGQRADTGTELIDHYYDRVYGSTSTTTDAHNFFAVPNQRGGGPTCIFRKTFRWTNFNAALGNPARRVSFYLPFNQLVRFKHQINATDLQTAPNFWEHGTPVFVIKFYNSLASAGTQSALNITGTKARMYYKDP